MTIANIIGIDPGSNALGISVMSIDAESLRIVKIIGNTYFSKDMYPSVFGGLDSLPAALSNDVDKRIYLHQRNLLGLFNFYTPFIVCYETPFIHHLHPRAYGVLTSVENCIRNAVVNYNHEVELIGYPPAVIKKNIGAGGNANKEEVKHALFSNKMLAIAMKNADNFDEHTIDAICVAYTYYTAMRGEKCPMDT